MHIAFPGSTRPHAVIGKNLRMATNFYDVINHTELLPSLREQDVDVCVCV